MDLSDVRLRLRTFYGIGVFLPAALITGLFAARPAGLFQALPVQAGKAPGSWLLLAAVSLAVAMPVLLRTLFAHHWRKAQFTPTKAFYRFQCSLLLVSLAAIWILPVLMVIDLPLFHQSGIILAALYALYYHYPSQRRLAFDARIFRVRDEGKTPAVQQ